MSISASFKSEWREKRDRALEICRISRRLDQHLASLFEGLRNRGTKLNLPILSRGSWSGEGGLSQEWKILSARYYRAEGAIPRGLELYRIDDTVKKQYSSPQRRSLAKDGLRNCSKYVTICLGLSGIIRGKWLESATSSSGAIGGRSNGPRTLLSRGKGRVTTVAACFEKLNF